MLAIVISCIGLLISLIAWYKYSVDAHKNKLLLQENELLNKKVDVLIEDRNKLNKSIREYSSNDVSQKWEITRLNTIILDYVSALRVETEVSNQRLARINELASLLATQSGENK